MTVLPIVTDLAALRVRSAPVTVFDDDLRRLSADLVETMRAAGGVGLAAVQVGVPMRVLCYVQPDGQARVMVNPVITDHTHSRTPFIEGCLSLPGDRVLVMRYSVIRVAWKSVHNKSRHGRWAADVVGNVLQHEIDHLNGILITDHEVHS